MAGLIRLFLLLFWAAEEQTTREKRNLTSDNREDDRVAEYAVECRVGLGASDGSNNLHSQRAHLLRSFSSRRVSMITMS